MKNILFCAISILAILTLASCSSDKPSAQHVDSVSYELSIQNVAPECVTTILQYIGAGGNDAITYLDGDDDTKVITSGRFEVDTYRTAFRVEQMIADESETEGATSLVGIRFTMTIFYFDEDGELIDTKEYPFDNVHVVEPSYLTKLFPRTYEYAIINEGDGKYTFRRIE